MVVGWWYERCMFHNLHYTRLASRTPDNLLYKHGSLCQLDEQPRSQVNGQQRRQTKEEKGKEEDRQKLPERKARSTKLEGAKSDIITLLLSILAQCAQASCTCEMHQYSKYRLLQLCVFSVILSSRS